MNQAGVAEPNETDEILIDIDPVMLLDEYNKIACTRLLVDFFYG